jgi:hypothetical protein
LPNHIFLVELDPLTLMAKSPARPLVLEGPRRPVEKNWLLFAHEGEVWAVYTIAPHTLLRLDLNDLHCVCCRPESTTPWDVSPYARRYGMPGGGAPPVRAGNCYYVFWHSCYQANQIGQLLRRFIPGLRREVLGPSAQPGMSTATLSNPTKRRIWSLYRRWLVRYRYVGGFYAFAAQPPFKPVAFSIEPVLLPPGKYPGWKGCPLTSAAEAVVFPSGAIYEQQRWIVSYGVHNAWCEIGIFEPDAITRHLVKISALECAAAGGPAAPDSVSPGLAESGSCLPGASRAQSLA